MLDGRGANSGGGSAGQSASRSAGRALVIADGSIAGLTALAIASEETVRRENVGHAQPPAVWLPAGGHDDAAADRAVRAQAGAYGAVYVGFGPATGGESGGETGGGLAESAMLIAAGGLAIANGCRRVIWAVQGGGDGPDAPAPVETIARSLDRALLAGRLVSLEAEDAGLPEVVIETPLVDLTDAQLAELAMDLSAPVETCWWWGTGGIGAAGTERSRWGRVIPAMA